MDFKYYLDEHNKPREELADHVKLVVGYGLEIRIYNVQAGEISSHKKLYLSDSSA